MMMRKMTMTMTLMMMMTMTLTLTLMTTMTLTLSGSLRMRTVHVVQSLEIQVEVSGPTTIQLVVTLVLAFQSRLGMLGDLVGAMLPILIQAGAMSLVQACRYHLGLLAVPRPSPPPCRSKKPMLRSLRRKKLQ